MHYNEGRTQDMNKKLLQVDLRSPSVDLTSEQVQKNIHLFNERKARLVSAEPWPLKPIIDDVLVPAINYQREDTIKIFGVKIVVKDGKERIFPYESNTNKHRDPILDNFVLTFRTDYEENKQLMRYTDTLGYKSILMVPIAPQGDALQYESHGYLLFTSGKDLLDAFDEQLVLEAATLVDQSLKNYHPRIVEIVDYPG